MMFIGRLQKKLENSELRTSFVVKYLCIANTIVTAVCRTDDAVSPCYRFRSCLRQEGSSATWVGHLYFNVIGMKCFALTRTQVCVERYWWGGCQRYGLEETAALRDPLPF